MPNPKWLISKESTLRTARQLVSQCPILGHVSDGTWDSPEGQVPPPNT
jgi:hypothetical protein